MYRLQIWQGSKLFGEFFGENLGALHLTADRMTYYGQRVVIHEVLKSLVDYEVIALVDSYNVLKLDKDPATGSERPLRRHQQGSGRVHCQKELEAL